MSLIHADNFNVYGTDISLMLNGRYASATGSIVSDPDGVSIPRVIRFDGRDQGIRRVMKTPTNKIGIGLRLWLPFLPSFGDTCPSPIVFSDATNRNMVFIEVQTTGALKAYVWDVNSGAFGDAYLLATTAGPVVTANAWWHIEAAFDASAKTLEVRVEGIPVISVTSGAFGAHLNNGPNIYQVGGSSATNGTGFQTPVLLKDYFVWDGLGSQNNNFLGACLVADLAPDADTAIGGWVPSTGTTAWNILNANPPAAATPNVSAAYPVPAPMTLRLNNLPANVTSVKGMVTLVRAAKTDGGDGQLQVSTVSGVSVGNGTDRPITAAQTYWEDVSELDPATSAPWSPVAVNAMGLKVNRTL